MERSFVDELPGLGAAALPRDEATTVTARTRVPRWLLAVGFWTLIVLAYSTRREVRLGPYEWMPLTWFEAFKSAVAQWYRGACCRSASTG